jgi:GNAT superfamily N-acetyltransferase
MPQIQVRSAEPGELSWISEIWTSRWGAPTVVSRGRLHFPHEHPTLLAVEGDRPVGLVTYRIDGSEGEIVVLDSLVSGRGIGTALLDAAVAELRAAGCRRAWLITTNDNLPAIHFYLRRGWRVVAIHRDAIDHSRALKPELPLLGLDGVPIRDEIEFELSLESSQVSQVRSFAL